MKSWDEALLELERAKWEVEKAVIAVRLAMLEQRPWPGEGNAYAEIFEAMGEPRQPAA